jgi:hypothetical protein
MRRSKTCAQPRDEHFEVRNEHRVEARARFWTFADLPRETLILKNGKLNNDKIHDQKFDDISKCAYFPHDITVFAPDQSDEQPMEN